LNAGDPLPDLERLLDLPALVAYSAATWDWYDAHYDPAVAAHARLPAPLVDGQMLGALLAEHALDAFSGRGRIVRMSFRFRSPVVAGETIRCVGSVEAVDGARVRLDQQVLVGDRVAVAPASTELDLADA
jgi:acyl dehydratase